MQSVLDHLTERNRLAQCPKHMATAKVVKPCDKDKWECIKASYSPFKVFVNIPYIVEYRPLRASIIATFDSTGMVPLLASGRSEGQPFRLCKICEMMQTAKYCVSDLSQLHLQNIPFELGFFIGLGRQGHSFILSDHKFIEDENKQRVRKFDAHLSNLKGVEVIYHENRPDTLSNQLLKRLEGDVPETATFIQGSNRGILKRKIEERIAQILNAERHGLGDEVLDTRPSLAKEADPLCRVPKS